MHQPNLRGRGQLSGGPRGLAACSKVWWLSRFGRVSLGRISWTNSISGNDGMSALWLTTECDSYKGGSIAIHANMMPLSFYDGGVVW